MRKSLVTLFLVCLAVSAAAVELPKQGFGLHIGWAQPILRLNTNTSKDSLATTVKLNGFKVGVTYDASYIAGFGSSMGLNYTFGMMNGGWKSENLYGMPYPRSRQLITYNELEVFIDWQYKFEIAKETYLILYTGPTIQCGLTFDMRTDRQQDADMPIEYRYGNGYAPNKDDYTRADEENNHFKRLNVTWGIGAGFQYQRYFLRGGYDFGLINPYANSQFVDAAGNPMDRYTRGRLDQWNIKIGMYLWYE